MRHTYFTSLQAHLPDHIKDEAQKRLWRVHPIIFEAQATSKFVLNFFYHKTIFSLLRILNHSRFQVTSNKTIVQNLHQSMLLKSFQFRKINPKFLNDLLQIVTIQLRNVNSDTISTPKSRILVKHGINAPSISYGQRTGALARLQLITPHLAMLKYSLLVFLHCTMRSMCSYCRIASDASSIDRYTFIYRQHLQRADTLHAVRSFIDHMLIININSKGPRFEP